MRRLCIAALLLLASCGGEELSPAERGRRVYASSCTVCHNLDPTLDGVMGPAVAGSSRELLEARLLHGQYPPGHAPKRDTHLMQPLPYLADEIDALAAYLARP